MASLNQCNFIGNAADAPEVRTFQDGGKVANIRIAVSERYTDRSGQPQENTEWIPCVINGKLADVAERFITKGMSLFVSGKYKTRQWQDQSGNKHYSTEIAVLNFQILDKKPQAAAAAPQPQYPTAPQPQYATAPSIPQGQQAPGYVQPPVPPTYQAPPAPPAGGYPQPGQPGNTAYPPMSSPAYTTQNPDDMPF